jgi:hypothetical protein
VFIVATALVLLTLIVLLHAEGRRFLCACGHFALWVGDWCSSNTSQQLLDPYSLTHVLHGFLFFWLIVAAVQAHAARVAVLAGAVVGKCAWEVFENTSFVINKLPTETAALGYRAYNRQSFGRSRLCAARLCYRTTTRRATFA